MLWFQTIICLSIFNTRKVRRNYIDETTIALLKASYYNLLWNYRNFSLLFFHIPLHQNIFGLYSAGSYCSWISIYLSSVSISIITNMAWGEVHHSMWQRLLVTCGHCCCFLLLRDPPPIKLIFEIYLKYNWILLIGWLVYGV